MCGIAFAIRYGDTKFDLDIIRELWCNMEIRGTDASGYYFERTADNGANVRRMVKSPIPASTHWDAIWSKDAKKITKRARLNGTEKLIMLHTRKATQGTRWENVNNMPIYSENYVLLHNGTIKTPSINKYKYIGKVDSEEILANLEIHKDLPVADVLGGLSGGRAIILKQHRDDKIYFYRHSYPLEIYYDKTGDILYGCSDAGLIPRETICIEDVFKKKEHAPLYVPQHYLFTASLNKRSVNMVQHAPDSTEDEWDMAEVKQ